jgi:hypothetical protein
MGRAKIHLTAEAKREANRAKSKRYYEKYISFYFLSSRLSCLIIYCRSKATINAQRRKTYKKTKAMYTTPQALYYL